MDSIQTQSFSPLPLSWARANIAIPTFNHVKLPFTLSSWIPTADIPHDKSFDELFHDHLSKLPKGFVLQSCNLALRDYLLKQGGQSVPIGAEAILDLPLRGKKSVRELARRGRRHGSVREIELNRLNQLKLIQLRNRAPSRQTIQLHHTERAEFDDRTRCFVLETPEKKWLGAITLSTVNPTYIHTEMILRHPDAPTGIMEALVTAIAQKLTQEGIRHLSLGNVTPLPQEEFEKAFTPHRHSNDMWKASQLAFRLGRKFNFAYNADGLWRFKNKFLPRWEPLYLCASPKLSWVTLIGLIYEMGYIKLVWNQFLESWSVTQLIRKMHEAISTQREIQVTATLDNGCSLLGKHPFFASGLSERIRDA